MIPIYTNDYIKLNSDLHSKRPLYGSHGAKWLPLVVAMINQIRKNNATNGGTEQPRFLDFGCGKGNLGVALQKEIKAGNQNDFIIKSYDPAIEQYNDRQLILPNKNSYDFITCVDVMEHVEAEYICNTLSTIRCCLKEDGVAFFYISTALSKKSLGDGRNCHISVHQSKWWDEQLCGVNLKVLHETRDHVSASFFVSRMRDGISIDVSNLLTVYINWTLSR